MMPSTRSAGIALSSAASLIVHTCSSAPVRWATVALLAVTSRPDWYSRGAGTAWPRGGHLDAAPAKREPGLASGGGAGRKAPSCIRPFQLGERQIADRRVDATRAFEIRVVADDDHAVARHIDVEFEVRRTGFGGSAKG